MSARATVLYDAPGPRGVRVNRILTAVTVVVAVAVLVGVLAALHARGQLDAAKWSFFVTRGTSWTT